MPQESLEAELYRFARKRRIRVTDDFSRALNEYANVLKRGDVVKVIPVEDHDFVLKVIGSEALTSLDPGKVAGYNEFKDFLSRRKIKEVCVPSVPDPDCETSVAAMVLRNRQSYEKYLRSVGLTFQRSQRSIND